MATTSTQRRIGQTLEGATSKSTENIVKYTFGKVASMFTGNGLIPSSLGVVFAEGQDPILGIPYAKNAAIAVNDTVLLLNLGGNYFAVCAVQP